jgi:asparagine synthase (glutamine-hydrolysing)
VDRRARHPSNMLTSTTTIDQFDRIKDQAASSVSDAAFEHRSERWPDSTPDTKEAYYIRDIFDSKSQSIRFKRSASTLRRRFIPA